MSPHVTIEVNGVPHLVDADATLAAALLNIGVTAFRRDHSGAPRAPLCGMGTCHECRVSVDGQINVRSCLEPVRDRMVVEVAG